MLVAAAVNVVGNSFYEDNRNKCSLEDQPIQNKLA